MGRVGAWVLVFTLLLARGCNCSIKLNQSHPSQTNRGLCALLIQPLGYSCYEHNVQTTDGYLLALQRISYETGAVRTRPGPPVFLQHGLFQAGDAWFMNSKGESLGFLLADQGFDVWVGNVRGTHWSYGHVSLSDKERAFWDWSWQELAQYDLAAMINYVYSTTHSKVFFVGHSQGTIMALAAFTQSVVVDMVEAAALLCPISYLGHITSRLILRAVGMHLDQMLLAMGLHQLNFRSDTGVRILDSLCAGHMDCSSLLSSITGKNCCFNNSRVDFYLQYEPHPSSTKNLNHLFQMIRKGNFALYDYGWWGNIKRYGHLYPPSIDLADIPQSLPLWMAYGGTDALADPTDVDHTIRELQAKPELLYLKSYGHIDFILSVSAKRDVYDKLIMFFKSQGMYGSY